MGRPPKGDDTMTRALTIRFPAALWTEIEAIRSGRLDNPDATAVIRELLAEAIVARKSKTK
jgi:hypothetical protein